MNLKTAKSPDDIKLTGIEVEFERKDGSVSGLLLRDRDGHMLVVRDNGYGAIGVFVPCPPKLVVRWRVSGAVGDVSVDEFFDYEHSAEQRIRELGLGKDAKPEKVMVQE